jgi:[ribosomal protein S5]-alanine N-acetyltransferase
MRGIRLVRIDRALSEALEVEPARFEALYQCRLGPAAELVSQVVEQTLANVPDGGAASPWGGYLAVDESSGSVVGTCGFKSPPKEDSAVEIAYFTFPDYERQGFATAMASELIRLARGAPEVQRIIARTLPEPNASTRVLGKVGMRFAGEVLDPEDGRVWEWEA